ncbi:hypothetical protein [Ferrimonas balearica]|uniref:hypothetical protein n=1 Tax=Ferrimonas balearica TaxID=44012 RepID=UPI001C993790|nr:hypothetical protein [Ferrimonas balearica]MBY5992570.1 hypothetical protein [Ferrimonas balearica]
MPLALATLFVLLLSACASAPPAPEHFFTTETDEQGELRFTFNYIQVTEPLSRRQRQQLAQLEASQPRRNRDPEPPLPGQGPLIDQHQLYLDLEKELDERGLCLEGYRIDRRHPTRQGISLSGRCR